MSSVMHVCTMSYTIHVYTLIICILLAHKLYIYIYIYMYNILCLCVSMYVLCTIYTLIICILLAHKHNILYMYMYNT